MAIQMKAIEQCFHVVLFIMLYKVVLTFKSLDETLVCDHLYQSYWAVLSCGTVYYAVQGGSNFHLYRLNPSVWPFKWKLLSSTFMWYCWLCCTRWFQLSSLKMKPQWVTIQMKVVEQYFHVLTTLVLILPTIFVDIRLWKTKHPRKRFQNFR